MFYVFVNDASVATGTIERDPEPRHGHCPGSYLHDPYGRTLSDGPKFDAERRWACAECGAVGLVQHRPTYVQRRSETLPAPATMDDPPKRPVEWQDYLDEYFAEGVLLLGADNEPWYPVSERSPFVVAYRVHIDLAPGKGAELVVADRLLNKPYYMRDVQRLSQIGVGTLIAHGAEGRVARLEARLTDEEKAFAHRMKNSDYFGVLEGCGDAACPFCTDKKGTSMDADEAARMTTQILTGISKVQAAERWGSDPEFSTLWDSISADIERQRREKPNIQFEIPSSGGSR